jgi:hypothetical protein
MPDVQGERHASPAGEAALNGATPLLSNSIWLLDAELAA